jgi:hypothetical protein
LWGGLPSPDPEGAPTAWSPGCVAAWANIRDVKLAAAIVGFVVVGLTACATKPQQALPTMYIIESGKTGWVKIVYNRPDEAGLPVQSGFAVAHIGQDLKVLTRSRMNPSWDGSQFYYQDADGKRTRLSSEDGDSRLIWAQDKTTDADGEREMFFVGNQEQLSRNLHSGWTGGFLDHPNQKSEKEGPPSDASKILTDLSK